MEPAPGISFLVCVVQKDLKGLLVGLALGVEHTNALLVGHLDLRGDSRQRQQVMTFDVDFSMMTPALSAIIDGSGCSSILK